MDERFTERTQRVFALAREESQRLKHDHIGTEHVLLGMAKEGTGDGAGALSEMGVNVEELRDEIERRSHGPNTANPPENPRQTARLGRALDYAADEAAASGHPLIGSEHLLLGILAEPDGTAARALIKIGVSAEAVRSLVRGKLDTSAALFEDLCKRAVLDLNAQDLHLEGDGLREIAEAIVRAGWRPRP